MTQRCDYQLWGYTDGYLGIAPLFAVQPQAFARLTTIQRLEYRNSWRTGHHDRLQDYMLTGRPKLTGDAR